MTELPPPPEKGPDTTEQLNALAGRLRINEERYSELRKKLLVVEQNMLSNHKKAINEIKSIQTDILESKRTMQAVEDKIITVIKELRLSARKEDIDVMKKYLDLWNPVKFTTQEQTERIVEEKLGIHKQQTKVNYDSP